MAGDLADALNLLAEAFKKLGIRYAIGGSVASSVRGIARATRDLDIVAGIQAANASELARALGADWYADADQMHQAILAGRAFNLIYIPKSQKIDVFPVCSEFHAAQLRRATKVPLSFLQIEEDYPVSSAEDILLAKLQWYREGGEVSERQWDDITNLLAVNQDLNFEYIDGWAARLHLDDLLTRALSDAS